MAADLLPWLLQEDNPPVRFFTLRNLLDRPMSDPEVEQARAAIMEHLFPCALSQIIQPECLLRHFAASWCLYYALPTALMPSHLGRYHQNHPGTHYATIPTGQQTPANQVDEVVQDS